MPRRPPGPIKRPTLKDVAREAGVSIATADRVLNKRPGVHPATVERVAGVAERLAYRPHSAAARLARGVSFRFRFVLPVGTNTFMANLAAEVQATAAWIADAGVSIEIVHVDVFNPSELARTLRETPAHINGVSVVALDHPEVRDAIDALVARGVDVVTLVSDLHRSSRHHFAGIDNSAAGRTAGSLIGRFVGPREGAIGLIVGSLDLRDHVERRFGFEQVLRAEFPGLRVLPAREARDDYRVTKSAMLALIDEVPDLVGVYNTGAGNRGIAAALEARGRADSIVFVGHDLTEYSRRFLMSGTMDAVVNQDPGHEARSAARVLLARAAGEPINPAQERIRIDIFIRDNLP